MRPHSVIVAAIALIAATTARAGAQGVTSARVAGWDQDATAFVDALASQHYVLRQKPLPDSVRAALQRFRAGVPLWSDDRALAELMRIAALAGDGHTYVLPFSAANVASHWLPLRFYQFSDGLFVIDALPGYERWIGARVRQIAGLSIDTAVARLRPYMARDNDAGGILFASALLQRFQGYLEAITDRSLADSVAILLDLPADRPSRRATVFPSLITPPLRGMPKLMPSRLSSAPPPRWLRDVATSFWMEPIGDTVLYVQFNQVQDTPQESLAEAAARLEHAIESQHPRLVIMDVRQNNGGNLSLLDPLIAVLSRFTGAPRPGRLVVLSGRHTFSAAQIFLGRAEHEARAEVAGEPSASKPNFVGEENAVALPWSGAIASVSNRYHESIPGDTRPWIEPRPKIYLSSNDYFNNRDPVLEYFVGRR